MNTIARNAGTAKTPLLTRIAYPSPLPTPALPPAARDFWPTPENAKTPVPPLLGCRRIDHGMQQMQ